MACVADNTQANSTDAFCVATDGKYLLFCSCFCFCYVLVEPIIINNKENSKNNYWMDSPYIESLSDPPRGLCRYKMCKALSHWFIYFVS